MSIALGYCRDCSGRRKLSIAARAGARVPLCEGCLGLAGLPALAWKDLTPAEKMACAESVLARESRPRKAALKKDGARHHTYTHVRGYHPLLAVAAGTGDVLMARLREGRANTARGAAHFLHETITRVRYAGASGELTVRADSGFYPSEVVKVCRARRSASASRSASTPRSTA